MIKFLTPIRRLKNVDNFAVQCVSSLTRISYTTTATHLRSDVRRISFLENDAVVFRTSTSVKIGHSCCNYMGML